MTFEFDQTKWAELHQDTLLNAIAVKTMPNRFAKADVFKEKQYTGRLHKPALGVGEGIANDNQLLVVLKDREEIIVISHKYDTEPKFVWRGNYEEFKDNWIGD